ncbi:hypothetical protein Clacol_008191 [Clathrus columnatus]|uniref:HMG box domain-containing protein n=1 Tax=Clathrus columnatus TaxID=1419009 RepID=A0AAV5AH22_9AGAM|nr:hypothetical protein Clacol_008191 [Clathrus columnatus]
MRFFEPSQYAQDSLSPSICSKMDTSSSHFKQSRTLWLLIFPGMRSNFENGDTHLYTHADFVPKIKCLRINKKFGCGFPWEPLLLPRGIGNKWNRCPRRITTVNTWPYKKCSPLPNPPEWLIIELGDNLISSSRGNGRLRIKTHDKFSPNALNYALGSSPPPALVARVDPKYTFSDVETDNERDSFLDSPEADIELLPPTSASSPVSPLPRSSHTRKRSPFHIRRPRNAFIIFRSEFCDQQKVSEHGIETDHRHISRIAAHIWNDLPEDKKIVYKRRAEEEKVAHKAAYPDYRYAPVGRPRSVVKQRPNRSSNDETLRCRKVAELYIAGLKGGELNSAIKALDETISTEPRPSLPQYVSPPTRKRTRPRPRPLEKEKGQKQINVVIPSPEPSSSPLKTGVWNDRVGPLEVCAPSQNDIKPAKSRAPSPEEVSNNEGEFNYLHDSSSFTMEPKEKESTESELMQDETCKLESRSTFSTGTGSTDLGSMDESSDVFSNLTLGQLFRTTPEFPDSPNSGLSYFAALSVNDSDESEEVLNASPGTPFPTSNEALFSDAKTTVFKLEGEEIIDTHLEDHMFMYADSRDMTDFDQYLDL